MNLAASELPYGSLLVFRDVCAFLCMEINTNFIGIAYKEGLWDNVDFIWSHNLTNVH